MGARPTRSQHLFASLFFGYHGLHLFLLSLSRCNVDLSEAFQSFGTDRGCILACLCTASQGRAQAGGWQPAAGRAKALGQLLLPDGWSLGREREKVPCCCRHSRPSPNPLWLQSELAQAQFCIPLKNNHCPRSCIVFASVSTGTGDRGITGSRQEKLTQLLARFRFRFHGERFEISKNQLAQP